MAKLRQQIRNKQSTRIGVSSNSNTVLPTDRALGVMKDLKVDDIDLIADVHVLRSKWLLGREVKETKSRGGHVRSCVVKTDKTQVELPITKLCLLELPE